MTYFIGQCIWEFRRVYETWAKKQMAWTSIHLEYDFSDGSATGIAGLLQAPGYLAEPEAIVFATNFEDILAEQPPVTQAVVRLTVAGFTDTEIAERLKTTPGGVRNRKTLFRKALYQAARHGRIWIPKQLHTATAKASQSLPKNEPFAGYANPSSQEPKSSWQTGPGVAALL
ncbi:response regulator transcription factor [Streptomyces sp. ISL-66]|uniref:hypothetical protein n=1 Tax=Streptomyces sp. ISL-66 TaxID=2819186 RepID=UPI001BE91F65|nr:hypothetical protein [Streptomyces sp. ISL-66]MBT2472816.1 response regulator transcription factor [Streptomyces sp. ISL-66]